jgi:uncharacterized protein (TIGR02246 family)
VTDEQALRTLLDIEEIKQLKARYFRTMDHKDWDGFGQVFTRDAVLEVPEVDMTHTGREEIVAFVSGALVGARTVHHGHMPEIELVDAEHARGTWAMFDYVEWPSAVGEPRVGLQGYGHYLEEYVREDGRWCIARSRLARLRIDPLGAGLPDLTV